MSHLSVLMVDDSQILLKIQTSIVVKQGYSVEGVTSAEAAIRLLKQHRYDIIVMDVQMPVMDGLQATQAIRALGIKTPILALTGNDLPEERVRCLEHGMDGFLAKPLQIAALNVELRKLHLS